MKRAIEAIEILGVRYDSSFDEIKSAYKTLAKKYHPDSHPDLSEAEKKEMARKFREIRSAYELLRKIKVINENNNYYKKEEKKEDERIKIPRSADMSYEDILEDIRRAKAREEYLNGDFFNPSPRRPRRRKSREQIRREKRRKMSIRVAAAAISSLIIVLTVAIVNSNKKEEIDNMYLAVEQVTDYDDSLNNEDQFMLNKVHIVVSGDTLSKLSRESNTTINAIKRENNLSTNDIYIGDIIKIPYYVDENDMQYYTKVVYPGNRSVNEIAVDYLTDVDTIMRLNNEAIDKIDGEYTILSDTILVPVFLNQKELKNKKENQNTGYVKK